MWWLSWLVIPAPAFDGDVPIAHEVCVEYERPRRQSDAMPPQPPALGAPISWVRAREVLGRGRWPEGRFDAGDFASWVPQPDPGPSGG